MDIASVDVGSLLMVASLLFIGSIGVFVAVFVGSLCVLNRRLEREDELRYAMILRDPTIEQLERQFAASPADEREAA